MPIFCYALFIKKYRYIKALCITMAIKKDAPVLDLIYGVHPVLELLKQKNRKVVELYTLKPEPKIWRQIKELLPKYPVTVHAFTRQALSEKLGTTDHQGIAALVQPYAYKKQFFSPAKEQRLLMLDSIQDVRNLGAIIRTAYCAGVNGIILTKCAPLHAAAFKASAGLAERIGIYQAPSPAVALQLLKTAGYTIYVAALSKKPNAYTLSYAQPLCLVVGNEEDGVSPETVKAGITVMLPQASADVSYNVSVATGMLLATIAQKIDTQK
jgi:23S rRNA (guanosine2251-2'-O)-methyltransferase